MIIQEAQHIHKLAETVLDAEECPFITYMSYTSGPSQGALAAQIHEALARGKTVVVKNYKTDKNTPLTTESIMDTFRVRKDEPVTVHGVYPTCLVYSPLLSCFRRSAACKTLRTSTYTNNPRHVHHQYEVEEPYPKHS